MQWFGVSMKHSMVISGFIVIGVLVFALVRNIIKNYKAYRSISRLSVEELDLICWEWDYSRRKKTRMTEDELESFCVDLMSKTHLPVNSSEQIIYDNTGEEAD